MSEVKIGKVRPINEIAKELADRLIRKREDDFLRYFTGVDWGFGSDTTVYTSRVRVDPHAKVYGKEIHAVFIDEATSNGDDVIDVDFRDVTLPALPAKS